MKNFKTKVLSLCTAVIISFSAVPASAMQASAYTRTTTHRYSCRVHRYSNDMYVKLSANFNNANKKCTSAWWSGCKVHAPNYIQLGSIVKQGNRARGVYRIRNGGGVYGILGLKSGYSTKTIYVNK